MPPFIDLTQQKFGRLTVLKKNGTSNSGDILWLCICSCGIESRVNGYNLRSGDTTSCGCRHKEIVTTHGNTVGKQQSKAYLAWQGAIARCENKNRLGYKDYGGRGIKVCDRWRNSFENFLEDMGKPPSLEHSIDRINNDKGYCKSNCRWSTRQEQARNRRDNHLITFNQKTQSIIEWSEKTGISPQLIRYRLSRKWPIDKVLSS